MWMWNYKLKYNCQIWQLINIFIIFVLNNIICNTSNSIKYWKQLLRVSTWKLVIFFVRDDKYLCSRPGRGFPYRTQVYQCLRLVGWVPRPFLLPWFSPFPSTLPLSRSIADKLDYLILCPWKLPKHSPEYWTNTIFLNCSKIMTPQPWTTSATDTEDRSSGSENK